MSNLVHGGQDEIYDVVGVGFGPSNLALAIAIEEHNRTSTADQRLKAAFCEKQAGFGWHRGMLIDNATMQVSFFKDLVTMRNPTSTFSFLCYLHERGRLVDFINHKTLFPLRVEFHDYFEWAARRVEHLASYSTEVIAVEPVEVDGQVTWFDVISREDGGSDQIVVRRARNICVAPGLQPFLPPGIALSERVWHTRELLPRAAERSGTRPRRIVVLGAGQSAAEAVAYLHRTFPSAEVCAVFARYGYCPADDSPYANRIFDPEAVDAFYHAPEDVKQLLLGYHRNTNYSVVDLELIEALYRQEYLERVQGQRRLRILNTAHVDRVNETADGLQVTVRSLTTGEVTTLETDVLVCATGYRPCDVTTLLGEATPLCLRDPNGQLAVERDYRLATRPHVTAGLYLQGPTEHSHGISASLLSNTAVRAGEILDSLRASGRDGTAAEPYALTGTPQ